MKSRETRHQVLDLHYQKCRGFLEQLEQYYETKTDDELRYIYAELKREQHTLGNIPLLASTTPIVFLIFGSQVNRYFPHDSLRWFLVVVVSVLIIVWSINHHFRKKGRVHLDLYLIEEMMKERSKNSGSHVQ